MIYFQEPYTLDENKTKIELDLSNYTTKFDSKSETCIDTSAFPKILLKQAKLATKDDIADFV